jgi:hypothetical protein
VFDEPLIGAEVALIGAASPRAADLLQANASELAADKASRAEAAQVFHHTEPPDNAWCVEDERINDLVRVVLGDGDESFRLDRGPTQTTDSAVGFVALGLDAEAAYLEVGVVPP